MKRIKSLLLLLAISVSAFAMQPAVNDTIPADAKDVSKWIEEPYINKNGKESVKYYAVWRGELINTSKTTIDKLNLCKKHGARVHLIVIGKNVNGVFKPKRIVTF